MLARIRFFVEQAVSSLARSWGITVLSVGTMSVALLSLATFVAIVENLGRVVDGLGRTVEISAYLSPQISPETIIEYQHLIAQWTDISEVHFISAEAAFVSFQAELGRDGQLLEGLPRDALPPSLEIKLVPQHWTSGRVDEVARRLAQLEGVRDVRFGQEDLDRMGGLLRLAKIIALILGSAIAVAMILVIFNTIRLTVYARKDEIDIMSLVGATRAWVCTPFVIEGMLQGLMGSLVAVGALFLLRGAFAIGIQRGLSQASQGFGLTTVGTIQFEFVPMTYLLPLAGLGLVLGLIGSLLAVGRFLKV